MPPPGGDGAAAETPAQRLVKMAPHHTLETATEVLRECGNDLQEAGIRLLGMGARPPAHLRRRRARGVRPRRQPPRVFAACCRSRWALCGF